MKPIDHSQKLAEFLEVLKKQQEIIGVMYFGSTATKKWHKYSDIDIDVVIKDKEYNKFLKKLPKLLSWWGNVKLLNHYENHDEHYVFVNNDFLKIEIDPHKKSNISPSYWFKTNKIVYDPTGFLKKTLDNSKKFKKPIKPHKDFIWFFKDTRCNFIYSTRHYARGMKLSGVSELGNIGGQLFRYLGFAKGFEDWENIRAAEKHLTKKEWAFLEKTKCKSHKKSEVIRAILTLWDFMKYVENLY